jgi:hypothetical protein
MPLGQLRPRPRSNGVAEYHVPLSSQGVDQRAAAPGLHAGRGEQVAALGGLGRVVLAGRYAKVGEEKAERKLRKMIRGESEVNGREVLS